MLGVGQELATQRQILSGGCFLEVSTEGFGGTEECYDLYLSSRVGSGLGRPCSPQPPSPALSVGQWMNH